MSTTTPTGWASLPPPQPSPDADTAAFWQATAEGRLAVCRCQDCGHWHMPPLERCRRCAGITAFEPVAGTGTIETFVVQRQPAVVGYFDQVPYTLALVDLDEQPALRIPGRVLGIEPDDVEIGMRVALELRPLPGGEFVVAVWHPG
jgi:uncharacterized OB-fold protein